jgi:uncharacterized protein YprB with RNaseH-like and TPR domain
VSNLRLENSFVLAPGIGRKTEKKLWQKGITHWEDVKESSAGIRNEEKVKSFLEKAEKNLEVGNEQFFGDKLPNKSLWRSYQNFKDSICFFDIETTGLDKKKNKVTTVSIHRNGETKTLIRGQDLTRENIQEELFNSSMLVSFNGKRFDQPFLEHSFNLEIENPHIDLMYLFKRLGYSGGLKKIEKDLDVERELEDIDGREAVKLWKRYEKKSDEEALQKLVKYNKYDTKNLEKLLKTAHNQLKQEIFDPHLR